MDIHIGIQYSPRDLKLDVEQTSDEVSASLDAAYASGQRILWLTDKSGRKIGIPLDKLAYIELDAEKAKSVGFAVGR